MAGEVATRVVVACGSCGTHWFPEAGEPTCSDEGHEHARFDIHRHRDAVTLPDGTEVVAVSFDPVDPYVRPDGEAPGHGLYLDAQWTPPWPHAHLDWPDFGVPADVAPVTDALRRLHDQARAGERVEIGCYGGHGRTGTALALLAVIAGHPATDAVAWVRANYCDKAVETPDQEGFVASFSV
jgi:protein-tyrosine phosphatase